ncbi:MAG: tyrosine-type recombinase/integrase [Holophagales bacterium]|nr:tyrosine-type recombinase/integrase [Holophagales bacterium]MYF06207.1 tyrosine-type recombinase/integrase [Holophagales bacterium]
MTAKRFTVGWVRKAPPGKHYDSGGFGLILRVRSSGRARWAWRGTVRGKRVELGLGRRAFMSLRRARETAFEYARIAADGDDPRTQRSNAPTFRDATESVIRLQRRSWKAGAASRRQEQQWRQTLATYAFPVLGDMTVDQVTAADVLRVLTPLWTAKPAAAKTVKQRIGIVLRWAIAQGFRQEDPMGAVGSVLPRQPHGGHHRFLPPKDIEAAMAKIRSADCWLGTRLAVRFLALTATRTAEVRGATWAEVDTEAAVWTIPANRVKTKREHRIPLSSQALEVLARARQLRGGGSSLIFPASRGNGPLGSGTMGKLLRELRIETSPHGVRASFRSWCADQGEDRALADAALGHEVGSATERAYQRSDLFERRRGLMERWGEFIAGYAT